MLSGALETYAAALLVIGASIATGAGLMAACGWRRPTFLAPVVGLAAITVIAWWTVRLPGHGLTALLSVLAVSIVGAVAASTRVNWVGDAARRAWPPALVVAAAVSIPFVVEGHFGVLGSGFNVDMSQHLFAAAWLSDPAGTAPGLFTQGYPLGPHALAVATGEVSGELATAFSGITIAIPVLIAITALGALREVPRSRATIAAALAALAYLTATYLAQGSFKEIFEAAFLLGFALWLASLVGVDDRRGPRWAAAIPGAVIAAGALYAYSGPGLAWVAGTAMAWGAIELFRRRGRARGVIRRALPVLGTGLAVLALLAVPEIDRIGNFGGSVGTVSDGGDAEPASEVARDSIRTAPADEPGRADRVKFDDDLGNLFGEINPLEVFGVWPSGDFRVEPGDGAVPWPFFYAGALLAIVALGIGVAAARRRGESALIAALIAAAVIWLAARIGSTPYTTAKALQMAAPVVMLLAARGLLDPGFVTSFRNRASLPRAALAAAFVGAATISSGLALANAPVGPREYTPGVTALSDRYAGTSTLILVPDEVLADEHGNEFYGWELREASEVTVAGVAVLDPPGIVPAGIESVITIDGATEPPLDRLAPVATAAGVTLWRVTD